MYEMKMHVDRVAKCKANDIVKHINVRNVNFPCLKTAGGADLIYLLIQKYFPFEIWLKIHHLSPNVLFHNSIQGDAQLVKLRLQRGQLSSFLKIRAKLNCCSPAAFISSVYSGHTHHSIKTLH